MGILFCTVDTGVPGRVGPWAGGDGGVKQGVRGVRATESVGTEERVKVIRFTRGQGSTEGGSDGGGGGGVVESSLPPRSLPGGTGGGVYLGCVRWKPT